MKKVESGVQNIIEQVKSDGDKALIRLTLKYDRVRLRRGDIRVDKKEIAAALMETGPGFAKLIRKVAKGVASYHKRQMPRNQFFKNPQGARVGWVYRPIETVGIYLPGGTAPLISTAIMTIVPARVAGVDRVVVCTPPGRNGRVNPYLLAACRILGADEIYRAGGAQAVAAMAFGTQTVTKVDKIVGPGNVYVTEAKRQLYGKVGIDMTAGPSEVAIIADGAADPVLIASDLLAQAEHDVLSRAILLTTSDKLLGRVRREIKRQLGSTKRGAIIGGTARRGLRLIRCSSLTEAVKKVNRIAPEHLEILVKRPEALIPSIRNAGAIFIGPYTATALGDYVAGPSHVLPTGGSARFSSVLSLETFLKRVSCVKYNRASLKRAAPETERLAKLEGLEAHADSIRLRTR